MSQDKNNITIFGGNDGYQETLNNLYPNHTVVQVNNIDEISANDAALIITADHNAIAALVQTCPNTPVILTSTGLSDEDGTRAMEAGATDAVDYSNQSRLALIIKRELGDCSADSAEAYLSDGMIIHADDSFAALFQYEADDLDCMPIVDIIALQEQEKFKNLLRQFQEDSNANTFTIAGAKADKTDFHTQFVLSNSEFDEEACIKISINTSESGGNAIGGLAFEDTVTGLYNRQYFVEQLEAALSQAAKVTSNAHVLYISIDKFSSFMTSHGISGGDQLITNLADLVSQKTDKYHYLSRFGDNSLVMLMPNSDTTTAEEFAQGICDAVSENVCTIDGEDIQYTVSIGGVIINAKSPREPITLLNHAYKLVDELRAAGKKPGVGNGVKMLVRVRKAGDSSAGADTPDLEEALDNDRFRLLFQPLLSLKGDAGDHYEAFVRMLTDSNEEVPPSQFFPLIEKENIGSRLDRWIILEAFKMLSQKQTTAKDTRLFINLTSQVFSDPGFLPWLKVAISAAGIPPATLIFQFMESELAQKQDNAEAFTAELSKLGCLLSIAHFGGSDHTDTVLNAIESQYVKLDASYTQALNEGAAPTDIKTIIHKATEQQRKAVIPCVENASLMAILWQAGTNFIQGNYLQVPSPEMNYEFSEIA